MTPLSPHIIAVISPFSILFSSRIWGTVRTLLLGTILCKGKRTVASILRTIGLSQDKGFSKYHRILNSLDWSPKKGSFILLTMLLKLAGDYLVFLIDETLERRKGKKIQAKGYYRDAVRSSHSQVVKTTGLKWLVIALCVRLPFANRAFALPFFSVLQPSKKCDEKNHKPHKTTLDWTLQMVQQLLRWIPNLPFILVGDGGFACGSLAWVCIKNNVTLVSRLKMNARLHAFPELRPKGNKGRRATKGDRLPNFNQMLALDLPWQESEVSSYGGVKRRVKYITHTSLWGSEGVSPVPIRWVLVVDPAGKLDPLPLMCTNVDLPVQKIIELYIDRWSLEVTFEEVREHLGVETQRQWADKAIARSTPILMSLYSMICLIGHSMHLECPIKIERTAWYEKEVVTFSDLIKAVRECLWRDSLFFRKAFLSPSEETPSQERELLEALLVEVLARAA